MPSARAIPTGPLFCPELDRDLPLDLTVPQAAALTGPSKRSMYRMYQAGQLPGAAIPGGDIRVATATLRALYGLTLAPRVAEAGSGGAAPPPRWPGRYRPSVPRVGGFGDHEHQTGVRVVGRSPGDPKRIDIAARQVRTGHRLTQRHRPHHLPIARGQRKHGVVLGGRDHQVPDHQGLPVHRPVQLGPPPQAQRAADG